MVAQLLLITYTYCNGYCRQEEFEKSAAGRAARAQQQAAAKQAASSNKGEPVLKVCVSVFQISC